MKYLIANLLLAFLPMTRWFGLKRRLLRALGVELGEGVSVCGHVQFHGAGRVAIGAQTWVGPNTRFYTAIDGDIRIGAGCDIAPDVVLATGTHEIGSHERRAGTNLAQPIAVGSGCWIGARAVILHGTSIGDGSIVAAGSVVRSGQYRPDTVLAGVPARVVRSLDA